MQEIVGDSGKQDWEQETWTARNQCFELGIDQAGLGKGWRGKGRVRLVRQMSQ